MSDLFRNFIVLLVIVVTILGPSAVIAVIGYASIRALGRNPSAAPKILQDGAKWLARSWSAPPSIATFLQTIKK